MICFVSASAAGFEPLPCNAFSFCPDDVCWEPDIHKHTKGDCWLKFTEGPATPEASLCAQYMSVLHFNRLFAVFTADRTWWFSGHR